jgi:hypothetical protein
MDNARLWAVQTSFDLEHWSMDDWSATNSIEQNRSAPANGDHDPNSGSSAAALLAPGVGMLSGNGSHFTPGQITELENAIESSMQRSLQRYFEGTQGSAERAGGRWGLNVEGRESGRRVVGFGGGVGVGRNQTHSLSHSFRFPPSFAALKFRSSSRQSRGLHRLNSNEVIGITENMNSESNKEREAVQPVVPPPTVASDLNRRSILVVIGGFFAYFATFGKS